MSRRAWTQTLLQAVIVVVAMGAGGVLAVNLADRDGAPPAVVLEQPTVALPVTRVVTPTPEAGVPAAAAAPLALPDIVDEVRRSVVGVNIVTLGSARGAFGSQPFRSEGEGAGIILDRQGHILTNYHVVEGADEVTVELWDGSVVRGNVVGFDEGNDLAVIRASVQPQRLTPARFGDSDAVRVGEMVFAIGSPFSFDFTVTSGIVSGVGRESLQNSSGRAIRGVIQIDAAVNPGNSGGPLFNARGEVIGVNTAIHNPTQQRVFVGVGLAIPANTVLRFLPDMIAGREITHPQLGISGVNLTAVNSGDAGVDVERGVYVTSVVPGSAADRAGLRAAAIADAGLLAAGGDVVIAIDGAEVLSIEQLARNIDLHDVGDEITLSVVRGGDQIELTVTLLEWQGG